MQTCWSFRQSKKIISLELKLFSVPVNYFKEISRGPNADFLIVLYFFRLTEREKREREYKKTVLKLAKDHHKAREGEKINRYYMPKDDVKPSDKYEEDLTEKGPNYEQKRWEEEHVGAAIMK